MKTRRTIVLGAILVALAVLVLASGCGTPPLQNEMSYQGRLTDAGGNPIGGTRDMTFRLFTTDTGGTSIWEEAHSVQVTDGLFNVVLGGTTALDEANFHQPLYLEVEVGGETLSPRQKLLAAPYAFSLVPGAVIKGYIAATETYSSTLNVANFLDVDGGQAIGAQSSSGTAIAGLGGSECGNHGIYGETGGDWCWSSGVYGRATKDHAIGVTGWNTAAGDGVLGHSESGDGVRGEAIASNKSGVYGHSTEGFGVTGRSTNNNGVQGFSDGVNKYGVYGHKAGTTGAAVYGNNEGNTGSGVIGESTNYVGVWGETDRPDGNYGIRTPDNMYVGGKIDLVGVVDPVIGERFEVDPDDEYEVGDLLVIDPNSSYLVLSTEPNDTKVIGVVGPGVDYKDGELMVIVMGYHGAKPDAKSILNALGEPMVGIAEETPTRTVAKIKVDATSYGAIKRGDLLTTSPTPGHAMKAQPVDVGGVKIYRPGTIIGKALESLKSGRGLIEVFIVLQ